ncbi:MAG: chromosomal replication initiator protein DnaA [Chitinispirillales bacterium]|jgi:chromosomal replication initiator protein|nr:chromosomal replication initiator protein DnaA [Chitinispirillales bacterium]
MVKKMTTQSLWENIVKSAIEKKYFQETAIDNLLRPLIPIKYMDGILVLETTNNFAPQVLNHRYQKKLNEIAKEFDKNFLSMKFVVAGKSEEARAKDIYYAEIEQTASKIKKNVSFSHPINRQYTFDEFIETYENRLVAASARGIANAPGKIQNYNPFFIYGKSGVGKTHIIHAIANEIAKNKPETNVILMSGTEFYRSYSAHLNRKAYYDFENIFQKANIIIFDNIDELAGKDEAQIELYKIFNMFHQQKRQMVITASCAPAELINIHERIITRLQWGLVVKLDMQNQETRAAILVNMAQKSKIKLSNEEVAYIVDNCSENIHELQGIIANIAVSTSINKTIMIQDAIQDALQNKRLEPIKGYFPPKTILNTICSYYKIDLKELKSKSRIAHIAYARRVAAYFLKKHTPLSLHSIGAELGGKNHSTILHSIKEVKNKIANDDKFSKELKDISDILVRS